MGAETPLFDWACTRSYWQALRWCSSTVKIDVLDMVIRRHQQYNRKIMVLTGERAEESTVRAKYKSVDVHRTATKKRKAVHWHPILDWKGDEVLSILKFWKVHHILPTCSAGADVAAGYYLFLK